MRPGQHALRRSSDIGRCSILSLPHRRLWPRISVQILFTRVSTTILVCMVRHPVTPSPAPASACCGASSMCMAVAHCAAWAESMCVRARLARYRDEIQVVEGDRVTYGPPDQAGAIPGHSMPRARPPTHTHIMTKRLDKP